MQETDRGRWPQRPPKMAIPRLPTDLDAESPVNPSLHGPGDRHRVGHACEPCRARKTRCSGERPTCGHCREHRLHCRYGDGKRDKARKEMGSLQDRVEEYERLLETLSGQVDPATRQTIQQVLHKHQSSAERAEPSSGATPSRARRPRRDDGRREDEDEDNLTTAEVGSTGSVDRVDTDLTADDQALATGFFGKNTEVSWMQHVAHRVDRAHPRPANTAPSSAPTTRGSVPGEPDVTPVERPRQTAAVAEPPKAQLSDFAYQADDLDLFATGPVDELELPPRELAEVFIDAYFATVHTSFPLLARSHLLQHYRQCFTAYSQPISRRWHAILNLVFAIGAQHCALVRTFGCDKHDHVVFFARARSLSLDHGAFWERTDLELVRVAGLATLYLMASEHISRAWDICGLAVRYAQALGLHLRNVSEAVSDVEKEYRVRLWWSIYALERQLEIRTGRPSAIDDEDLSTPLPVPVAEEAFPAEGEPLYENTWPAIARQHRRHSLTAEERSPREPGPSGQPGSSDRVATLDSIPEVTEVVNSAAYFIQCVRLYKITHVVSKKMYSAPSGRCSWATTQKAVADLREELSKWRSELPDELSFRAPQLTQNFARERLALGMLYCSAIMLVTRSCLCEMNGRIADESSQSQEFTRASAIECIHAAREMLGFLPDQPNAVGLYSLAPWWDLVHHLVQAAAVLVMELSNRAEHVPGEAPQLVADAKKAVRWLWAMSEHQVAAGRAWRTMVRLLSQVAPLVGEDTSDLAEPNPRAALPLVCEPSPYGVAYQSDPGHRPAFDLTNLPLDLGLDLSSHAHMDLFYPPGLFSSYESRHPFEGTDASLNRFFSTTEETGNMDLDEHND